jgi:hypothetical protein
VGFPIRKSSDQSSFAAPRSLSQRTTSFIASQRQGIHRMLLRHLIVLIIDARRSAAVRKERTPSTNGHRLERPVSCSNVPGKTIRSGMAALSCSDPNSSRNSQSEPNTSPLHDVMDHAIGPKSDAKLVADERDLSSRVGTKRLVEPVGIEPTTSCLQSTRSPD